MERQPFNLIEEREKSSREYREHRARLRELTTEPVELTPREEMSQQLERAEAVLSELHPGSPGALSAVCSCLLDVVDALTYVLERDQAETHT